MCTFAKIERGGQKFSAGWDVLLYRNCYRLNKKLCISLRIHRKRFFADSMTVAKALLNFVLMSVSSTLHGCFLQAPSDATFIGEIVV